MFCRVSLHVVNKKMTVHIIGGVVVKEQKNACTCSEDQLCVFGTSSD